MHLSAYVIPVGPGLVCDNTDIRANLASISRELDLNSTTGSSAHTQALPVTYGLVMALAKGGAYLRASDIKWFIELTSNFHGPSFSQADLEHNATFLRRCPIRWDSPSLQELYQRTISPNIRSLAGVINALSSLPNTKEYAHIHEVLTSIKEQPDSVETETSFRLLHDISEATTQKEKVAENLKKTGPLYSPQFDAKRIAAVFQKHASNSQPLHTIPTPYFKYATYLAVCQTFDYPTNKILHKNLPSTSWLAEARNAMFGTNILASSAPSKPPKNQRIDLSLF
jgi:hypothetical protein